MSTVARIADDLVLDVLVVLPAECLVQIPACLGRAHDIVPPLDDNDRQMLDLVCVFDQLTILHPSAINKVVGLDSRESESPKLVSQRRNATDVDRDTDHLGSSDLAM